MSDTKTPIANPFAYYGATKAAPLVHLTHDGRFLCPACANKQDQNGPNATRTVLAVFAGLAADCELCGDPRGPAKGLSLDAARQAARNAENNAARKAALALKPAPMDNPTRTLLINALRDLVAEASSLLLEGDPNPVLDAARRTLLTVDNGKAPVVICRTGMHAWTVNGSEPMDRDPATGAVLRAHADELGIADMGDVMDGLEALTVGDTLIIPAYAFMPDDDE
jgi:hypothetical protein